MLQRNRAARVTLDGRAMDVYEGRPSGSVAVHLGRDDVDETATAAVETAGDLGKDVALDEVVQVEDAHHRIQLAGMFTHR